jgi:hypothetical protein
LSGFIHTSKTIGTQVAGTDPGRVLKFNIEDKFYEVEDEEGNVSNVDEKNAVFVSRESLGKFE